MAFQKSNIPTQFQERITSRHCATVSAGAVLLANNLPSLFVTFTFPFFMHRLPFISSCIHMFPAGGKLYRGRLLTECCHVIGWCLHYQFWIRPWRDHSVAVAAWSSGTGGAGLIGAFAYAFLTEKSMAGLDPRAALLVQLLVPVVFALTYFLVLVVPDDVYTPGWHPRTWIVYAKIPSESQEENDNSGVVEGSRQASKDHSSSVAVPQRQLTFKQKIQHILVRHSFETRK
ncbi:CLN3 protein [Cooperia oncophora]